MKNNQPSIPVLTTTSIFWAGSPLRGVLSLAALLAAFSAAFGGQAPPLPAQPIPWSQIGAKAGADYKGDGLAVSPSPGGARLRCVFQRLEGEATREGLWLTSTVTDTAKERFRLTAVSLGRASAPHRNAEFQIGKPNTVLRTAGLGTRDTADLEACAAKLSRIGTVKVADNLASFVRPGLVEEYSVSMDGVRQDFVVLANPRGAVDQPSQLASSPALPAQDELRLELEVTGANVESAACGAQLVLPQSGRKIAYSRLRVTDAAGRQLAARMEVGSTRALAVLVDDTEARYPVRIDPTFSDANWLSMGDVLGADSDVSAAVVDGSGNLYIGGNFTLVGNTLANRIAKWNGTTWSPLGSGMDDRVQALAVSGGDLYAGGWFTTAGGNPATNIAKWNGSTWSPLGSGMNGLVFALAVSGNDLFAGGYFTMAGGSAVANIAKWNGSSWSPLGSGMGSHVFDPDPPIVFALAVSGSDLYAGGLFTIAGGTEASYVAKWNGSSWSPLGSGIVGDPGDVRGVYALAVSGSDLYAGGWFITAGGSAVTNIAKWNGSSWSPLGPGLNRGVLALTVSGTDLYAGGYFTRAGGMHTGSGIAKWNGSSWSGVDSGMGPDDPFTPSVHALV
jgi:hypothetical protein